MQPARVLLVDAYRDALFMWAFYLRTRGFEVITASQGRDAVRLAIDEQPDLIVMDLVLPDISGLEAARQVRADERTRTIPMLATTGDTNPGHLDAARSIGFVRLMIKPLDPPRLITEIQSALAARSSVRWHSEVSGPLPAVAPDAGSQEERHSC
jgi:two-component system cell cycle response regulator DivK